MRARYRIGLNCAPLLLRVMLGAVFLQAGLAKLLVHAEFAPVDAVVLADMGAIPAPAPATPEPSRPDPATSPAPAADAPAGAPSGGSEKDFAAPVRARAVNGVAVVLWRAAHPQAVDGGTAPMALWPAALAEGSRPVYLAYAVAAVEAGGGALMLLGVLTRFWAAGVAVVMMAALWLTQIGPAVAAGDTWLGFLPRRGPLDVAAWQGMWVQVALMMSGLALAALGAGRLSVDRLIFGGRADE
jgi:uncharacterized membrane protein YphA (DoxX/SURF4 family)